MKKKTSRRLLLGATLLLCLLVLILFYAQPFDSNVIPFDDRMQQSSNDHVSPTTAKIDKEVEDRESLRRLVRGEDRAKLEATGFACDSAFHSLVCVADKPVVITTNTMMVLIRAAPTMAQTETVVQPYARQEDKDLMKYISPVHILEANISPPHCHYSHSVPAIVFSSAITGNLFHELNDIIIPLFITSRHFQSRVRFIVFDYNPSFIKKYHRIFSLLSSNQVMNQASNGSVHCFPGAVVGLKYHDNLALNSSEIPGGYSMPDFKQFLWESFNLKVKNANEIRKPVLIFISRRKTRVILNENELVGMMKELGFRVILSEVDKMSNLDTFAKVVNSCNVMVGAHGAGLTNEVFLPTGAVMVQVVPLGLTWASDNYYGEPALQMGVKYLEYTIEPRESSLIDVYAPNDPVIIDPESMLSKGYQVARALYIDRQNMTINITRFKPMLVAALGHLEYTDPLS